MKLRRKIILIVMIAMSVIFIRNTEVNAYTGEAIDENGITWSYTVENDEIVEISYKEGEIPETLYIPGYLNGYPLTKIQNSAFYGNNKLINIVIPDTVTSIGYGAFMSCSNLLDIDLPSSIDKLGGWFLHYTAWYENHPEGEMYLDNIFYGYKGNIPENTSINIKEGTEFISDRCFYAEDNIISINIPSTVKHIPYNCFYMCDNLETVIFETNSVLSSIEEYAFAYCPKLTSVVIPNSVTEIRDWAFVSCKGLTSIEIPEGVTILGRSTFWECTNLSEIIIPDSVIKIESNCFYNTPWYNRQPDGELYINNILYSYKGSMPANSSITVKEGTTYISGECFYYISNLTSIVLPDSLEIIGDRAFYGCTGLTNIEIPTNVEYIGNEAFYNCTGLTNIEIPSNVTSIESRTFQGCSNLITVKLPENLKNIGENAFYECTSLKNIEIPNTVTSIGPSAFYKCSSVEKIVITNPIEIQANTFYQCTNLEEVQLLGGVLGIGEYAFYSCTKLSDVLLSELPEDLYKDVSIGTYAFVACQSLVEITLPTNISEICEGAFSNCTNLEKVNVLGTINSVGSGAFYNTKIISGKLEEHFKDKEIVDFIIEEGIGEIYDDTFIGSENLKSVHVPSTVYYIAPNAFNGCNNLETVTISKDNPYFIVEDGIIYNKNKTILIRCLPGKNTKVEIPDTVTEMQGYAFVGCSKLKGTLTVPGTIKNIPDNAFERCTSEIPLVLENGIEYIGRKAFANSHFIGDLTIPDTVKEIDGSAFFNCNKFDGTLNLGKVEYVRSFAFAFCDGFTGDLIIPEEINSISQGTFQNCTGFNGKLYIGQSVSKGINEYAFLNCIGIREVVGNISYVSRGAFANCISLTNTGNVKSASSYAYYRCKSLKEINVLNSGELYSGFDGASSLEEVRIPEGTEILSSCVFARCTNLKTVYIPSTVTYIYEHAFYKSNNIENIYVQQEKANVDFDEILRKYCDNIHYLDDSVYTVDKTIPQNIEIIDVENSSEEGIKYGNTYKFKVQAIEGYEITDVIVKVKKSDEEIQLEAEIVDGESIYTVEDVKENIEIIVTGNVEEVLTEEVLTIQEQENELL